MPNMSIGIVWFVQQITEYSYIGTRPGTDSFQINRMKIKYRPVFLLYYAIISAMYCKWVFTRCYTVGANP